MSPDTSLCARCSNSRKILDRLKETMNELTQAAQVMRLNIQHTVTKMCGSNKNPTNTKNVKN
jgi:hypothetical protein